MNLSIGLISSVLVQQLPVEDAARVMACLMKEGEGVFTRGDIHAGVADLVAIAELSHPTDVSELGDRVTESARETKVAQGAIE